ncbi:MAG: hypothetical protein ACXVGI_09780 [Mycobacteriaceae bacterium]
MATLPAAATAPAPAPADVVARPGHSATVTSNGSTVHIDHTTLLAGRDSFKVVSTTPQTQGGGSVVTLWQPKHGVKVDKVYADLREEFSQNPAVAARGTRDLNRDVLTYGLADVVPGFPEIVTVNLRAGTYYLSDLTNFTGTGKPTTTSIHVVGKHHPGALFGNRLVVATSSDRFIPSSIYWPHRGSYIFHNGADTIHFMAMQRVKNGTTDAQVQRFFDSGAQGQPSFAQDGPSGGNFVVTSGKTIQVNYSLPRGTYVLLCYVRDDVTGMPHAFMGMHKVIHLI